LVTTTGTGVNRRGRSGRSSGKVFGFLFEVLDSFAYSGSQGGQLAAAEKQYQHEEDDYNFTYPERTYHGLTDVRFFSGLFPEQVFDLIEQLEEFLGLPVAVE